MKIRAASHLYRPMGKPMAWVFTIARNLAMSRLRIQKQTCSVQPGDLENDLSFSYVTDNDDRMVLLAVLELLNDQEREIILLHAVSGLTHREIANDLVLPLSTVLSKYHRGLKKAQKTSYGTGGAKMKKTDIEEAVKRAVEQAPTVDFEKLAAMPVNKMSSHDYITGQPEKQKSRHMKRFSAAFACCAVILVLFSGWFTQYGMPDSVIALDVNPSIEIVTNRHDQILSINALNEDAKDVLAGKKFDRDDLKGSVDTIIEALISQGFLNADKNVVLVSVENKDIKKADKLAAQVDEAVRGQRVFAGCFPGDHKPDIHKR